MGGDRENLEDGCFTIVLGYVVESTQRSNELNTGPLSVLALPSSPPLLSLLNSTAFLSSKRLLLKIVKWSFFGLFYILDSISKRLASRRAADVYMPLAAVHELLSYHIYMKSYRP